MNAPPIDARITRSDSENLYAKTEAGQEVAIPRSEVVDIDHPGDTATGLGVALSTYGILNIAVGAPKCQEEGASFCTGVFLPAGIGIPMFLWGLATHRDSVRGADSRTQARTTGEMALVPVLPVGGSTTTGAAMALTF